MLRGLYTAASALLADQTWQAVIGNNLDNLATPGYKADQPVMGEFDTALLTRLGAGNATIGSLGAGSGVTETVANLAPGSLDPTGRSLDVAPVGGAWLAVATAQGVRYTQDGALSLSRAGEVVNTAGQAVLGVGGRPIVVPAGARAAIRSDGTVTAGGTVVGRLLLTSFSRPTLLQAQGGGLFQAPAGAGARAFAAGAGVESGYLEGSNVDASAVTTQLIQVQNDFQANQVGMTTADRTFSQLMQDLGK